MASATLSEPHRQDSTPLRRLRAVDASTWAKVGLAVLCVGALVGYFAYPTYPTYDSFYALLWGRDLLHLHLPDFRVYRGPTEHPLAIAFGMLCSIIGQSGARLMVFGSIASFVAVLAGMYRLGRLCFGPVVGLFAALLVLSRFFVENLAAQGYLDISYVALIVWAIVFEVERPRRGTLVFLTLAAAGLLRPDAWVLSGVYWLWCAWPRYAPRAPRSEFSNEMSPGAPYPPPATPVINNRRRLAYLSLALIAPIVWVCVDAIVTGNPLYSLSSTAELAQELERTQGLSSVVASVWTFGVRIDKLPVILGGLIGVPIAIWLAPRRVLTPLAALILLIGVFVAEGAAGASVIDRYLMGASIVLLLFCAVTIGGWAMLRARISAAAHLDGWRRGAGHLRRRVGRHDAEPVEPAHDAGLPRGLPRGTGGGARKPARARGATALPAGLAAGQQADPRCALDSRQRRSAEHRRAQSGAPRRRGGRRSARRPVEQGQRRCISAG